MAALHAIDHRALDDVECARLAGSGKAGALDIVQSAVIDRMKGRHVLSSAIACCPPHGGSRKRH